LIFAEYALFKNSPVFFRNLFQKLIVWQIS
jgi:hypothetical protein